MMLKNYEIELSKLIPNALDLIPSNFDYTQNIAIEIKIAEGIDEKNYCNDITLQVRFVGMFDKKFEIINKTLETDKLLNQHKFSNNDWIIRENIWYTSYIDEEKFNTVLMYKIRNYK
ncbi:hypothetical protein ACSW8Q_17920 (plasmid) [Clostridium perfringens]|uniref:hypothetical protein n=1 Tax=Clostridium perfringens TaxID=1502 RepID=UPI0013E2F7AF|nr:hypothetical protein [Clostridium perfringens]EJT6665749.1 hypothetical protein [Clostridium perfringens]MDM0552402.1 hypothetical protein [Clostridium perfringens]NGT07403.1 hypothetical protein [Clostridium perfringens]HAT4181222.1 hypothetical protein [Clostridium perfringens]HAT4331044.1 hypothetical protein [Clostridium perfringens]